MTPFFINSNICVSKADVTDLSTFMRSVCGNTGNSYITYALVKEICPTIQKLNHIQNIYTYDFSTQDKILILLTTVVLMSFSFYKIRFEYQNLMI